MNNHIFQACKLILNNKRLRARVIGIFALLFFLILNSGNVTAQTIPAQVSDESNLLLHLFYGQGCPHCEQALDYLGTLRPQYPQLKIFTHEVYFDKAGLQLFQEMSAEHNVEIQGVPTIFIGDEVIVGFGSSTPAKIQQALQNLSAVDSDGSVKPPETEIDNQKQNNTSTVVPSGSNIKDKITIPAVIIGAAVDAINPCEFAVLIILLSSILANSNKRRALFAGLAFSLSIFISYYLMGLGLYSAIQYSGITHIIFIAVAIFAILIGLFNLKDFFCYNKWFNVEVPKKWRPRMQKLLRAITSVPGAFLIGFVISLFLLPCTSGPYIVILGLLGELATRSYALWLLLLYNLIFILPMIIITLIIYFGFATTEAAQRWRDKRLKLLHGITGIIILLLGVGMLIAVWKGII